VIAILQTPEEESTEYYTLENKRLSALTATNTNYAKQIAVKKGKSDIKQKYMQLKRHEQS
jgi:hypothetical protein